MREILIGIVGYAIGTVQVLVVDWVKRRRDHATHLRAIRAELNRALSMGAEFGWDPDHGPQEDRIPQPPSVSPAYPDLISSTDFHLTDEFEGDNAQQALLTILDGLSTLHRYQDEVDERINRLGEQLGITQRGRVKSAAVAFAVEYDQQLRIVQCTIHSALDDIDRRLGQLKHRRQIVRAIRGLPEGENPPPIGAPE